MDIIRSGSQPSVKASADYFTGTVRIDMPFKGSAPARIGGAFVTFEPGARTAWHTHPFGANAYRHIRLWLGAEARRPEGGNPSRRCGLDSFRRKALARRYRHHSDDPHRDRRGARRKDRGMDGKSV